MVSDSVSNQPTIFRCPILTSGEALRLDTFSLCWVWTLINFLVFTNAFYKIDATFLIVPCSYDQYCPERLIWHSNCHYFLLIIRIERPFTDNLQAIPRGSHLFRIFALDQVSNTFMMFSFNTKSWQPSIAVFFLFFLFSASGAWGDRTRDWGVGPGKRILIFNDPWIEESIWNKSIQCQFKNFFVPFEFEPQWYSIIFMVLRWVISSQASGQTPASISGTRWLEKCRACLCCTCLNSTKTDNSNF